MSISYLPEQKEYKPIGPFKRYIMQNFPWINEDFDALTNNELLAKVIEYLNVVIANSEIEQENIESLYNAFVQLNTDVNNYFDDLDVQNEINVKLDKMAQDGTLANIVGQYVQPLITQQNNKINQLEDTIETNNLSINTQIATINNRMNSLTSGAPAGTYPTLNALILADPERSKIYIVREDNNWYYYNTTNDSWTAGGQYFAGDLSISDNIDVTSLYFGDIGNQLFDYTKTDARGYYRVDGTFSANANMTGMYIDLTKIDASEITTNIQTYSAFLDESKNVITAYVPMSSGTYSIPSDAKYLYVSNDNENAYRVMVNAGSTGLPLENYERKLNAIIPAYNETMIELEKGFDNEVITPESITNVHVGNNKINLNSKMKEQNVRYSYTSGARVIDNNYDTITIPAKPNTNYVASNMIAHISEWTMKDIFIQGALESNVNTPQLFTTSENVKYLKISYSKPSVTDVNIPMLNEGTTVIPYEPYNISIDGLTASGSKYRPYQSGFIQFNVSVNQVIPEVTTTDNIVSDNQVFEDVGCMLKLPMDYTATGKSTKLLMVCHGAGRPVVGAETCWINTESYVNMINYFVNNGYAVFDCNGASNTHYDFWGSPVGISAYRKAYEYVVNNYNVESDLYIYGFSMGGLTALNLIMNDFPNVKAVALGSPVINLEEAWNNNIATLYSTQTTTYSDSLVAGYNPYLLLKIFNNNEIIFKKLPPVKIWYGGNETHDVRPYVDKAVGQRFVNAIKNSNGVAQYREFANCGHEICYGSNQNAYIEFAMWLNRF